MADTLTLAHLALTDARFNVLTDIDLLKLIFDNLNAQSLCAVEAVCKLWRGNTQTAWVALLAYRWPNSVETTNADIPKQTYRLHAEAGKKADFSFKVEMWHDPSHGHDPEVRVPLILKTFHGAQALDYDTRFEIGFKARFGIRFKCDSDSNHALDAVCSRPGGIQSKLSLTVMYASDGAVQQKVYTGRYRTRLYVVPYFAAEPVVFLPHRRAFTRLTMKLSRNTPDGPAWQMTIDVDGRLEPNSTDTILDVLADNVTGRLRDGRLLP